MLSPIYILIIILIPLTIPIVRNKLYDIYTHSLLRNKSHEKYVENFVKGALKKVKLEDYMISKYNDIRILKTMNSPEEKISVEVFIITKNKKWNVIEKLIKIDGIKTKSEYKYINIGLINSYDLGKLVPENSTKFQNKNFR